MNTEQRETEPRQNNIKDFLDNVFLVPYLTESGVFQSSEERVSAQGTIHQLIDVFFQACQKSHIKEVTAGGTTMEAYSEQEVYGSGENYTKTYWGIKKKFLSLDPEITKQLSSSIRGDITTEALVSLGGEPDLDVYVSSDEQIENLHENLQTSILPEGASISFGPISETNKVKRLCLSITSQNGNKIFHIDSTAPPTTGDEVALNRRIGTTDYQSQVCHRINTSSQEIISKPLTDLNAPTSFDLSNRNPGSAIEIILRQIRKTQIRRVTHQQESSITDVSNIFDEKTVFDIIHLASDPKNRNIFDRQSRVQQKMWLMEFYTILMTDLQSVDTLFQLKLLPLIVGQSISRKQLLSLMSSSSYTYNPPSPEYSNRTRNRNVHEIKESLFNFRKLPINSNKRNGLNAFARSLESINKINKSSEKIIRGKSLNLIFDTLAEWGGGITTTMLHRIMHDQVKNGKIDPTLSKSIPPLSETGKTDFSRLVVHLIAEGHIEVVTRNLNSIPVRFLYPTNKTTKISESIRSPFSTAEAVFGLRVSDSKLFPSTIKILFDNLDHIQRLVAEKQQEDDASNPWFDPKVD